jgi:K+-transporting ATPase c subunit
MEAARQPAMTAAKNVQIASVPVATVNASGSQLDTQ